MQVRSWHLSCPEGHPCIAKGCYWPQKAFKSVHSLASLHVCGSASVQGDWRLYGIEMLFSVVLCAQPSAVLGF